MSTHSRNQTRVLRHRWPAPASLPELCSWFGGVAISARARPRACAGAAFPGEGEPSRQSKQCPWRGETGAVSWCGGGLDEAGTPA